MTYTIKMEVAKMLKIVDVMKIGEMLSVIVEGDCKELKNKL